MKALKWKQLPMLVPALIYALIYLLWFAYIEQNITTDFTLIHMQLDDSIPFLEGFVIPYFLWFPYLAISILYFCLTDKSDYKKTCCFLFTGMTIFLIVSTLFPNGHNLRPSAFEHNNLFTRMIAGLYATDTATNIVPSIHVFNSVGISIAFLKSEQFKNKKWIKLSSVLLSTSIVLSTMFIKQHSVFDVITAFLLAGVLYPLVYVVDYKILSQSLQAKKRKSEESAL